MHGGRVDDQGHRQACHVRGDDRVEAVAAGQDGERQAERGGTADEHGCHRAVHAELNLQYR